MAYEPAQIVGLMARLRKERGVSLRELARKADIAPASLSAIENGQSSPTLATVNKLLQALGTDFVELLAPNGESERSPVFGPSARRTVRDAHREYTFLFPRRHDLRFEMMSEVMAPGEPAAEWETHDFDIGGCIIEGGPFVLEVEGEGQWTLQQGDAFYVRSRLRHRGTNAGDKPLRLITVADPPRY